MNLEVLLVAIALVESNGDDNAVGKAGERSRYQIMEYVWYQHCAESFEMFASAPQKAKGVAEMHILWIIAQLHRARVEIDETSISACWNAGVTGYLKHGKGHAYAKKVKYQYDKLIKL